MEYLKPPPVPRSPLRIVAWVLLIIVLVSVAGPLTVWGMGYFRWKMLERELTAKGEKLSLADLVPPAVPDAENFYHDPVWEELSRTPQMKGGERQLDRLNPPLENVEMNYLKEKYPEVIWPASYEKRSTVVLAAWNKRPENLTPKQTRHLAEFVVEVLAPSESLFQKLRELSDRPKARFPVQYELGAYMPLPHLTLLMTYGQMLGVRAKAEIALGEGDRALADILQTFALANRVKDEPLLISYLVRAVMVGQGVEAIAEGLKVHAWNDGPLRELQSALTNFDFGKAIPPVLRHERASLNTTWAMLRKSSNVGDEIRKVSGMQEKPDAFLGRASSKVLFLFTSYYDQETYNRLMQVFIEEMEAAPTKGYPAKLAVERELTKLGGTTWEKSKHLLTFLALPAIFGTEIRCAEIQDRLAMGQIACALERYWLKEGRYPDALYALAPDYLQSVPVDVVDLQPFKYQLRPTQEYLLYSVGIDHRDDGGELAYAGGPGDWVWGKIGKKKTAPASTE